LFGPYFVREFKKLLGSLRVFFEISVDSQKRSMGLSASTAAERQKKENKQAQNRE